MCFLIQQKAEPIRCNSYADAEKRGCGKNFLHASSPFLLFFFSMSLSTSSTVFAAARKVVKRLITVIRTISRNADFSISVSFMICTPAGMKKKAMFEMKKLKTSSRFSVLMILRERSASNINSARIADGKEKGRAALISSAIRHMNIRIASWDRIFMALSIVFFLIYVTAFNGKT